VLLLSFCKVGGGVRYCLGNSGSPHTPGAAQPVPHPQAGSPRLNRRACSGHLTQRAPPQRHAAAVRGRARARAHRTASSIARSLTRPLAEGMAQPSESARRYGLRATAARAAAQSSSAAEVPPTPGSEQTPCKLREEGQSPQPAVSRASTFVASESEAGSDSDPCTSGASTPDRKRRKRKRAAPVQWERKPVESATKRWLEDQQAAAARAVGYAPSGQVAANLDDANVPNVLKNKCGPVAARRTTLSPSADTVRSLQGGQVGGGVSRAQQAPLHWQLRYQGRGHSPARPGSTAAARPTRADARACQHVRSGPAEPRTPADRFRGASRCRLRLAASAISAPPHRTVTAAHASRCHR